jgi:hypothetical protein
MSKIEKSDGFTEAAESMRALAAKEADPSEKEAYLSAAQKFEEAHLVGERIFAEADAAAERSKALAERLLRKKRFTHTTWEFWFVVTAVLAFLGYAAYKA